MHYKEDMSIDPMALDVAWLEQPALARRYGENAAEMRRLASLAEENVKVVKSDLIRVCNEDPIKCTGKEKPTAQDVEAYYRSHISHKEAKEKYIEAQYQADIAQVAQMEVSLTRKATLENLVKLFIAQYFSGPKVPHDLSEEWRKHTNENRNDEAVAQAMKRKRRT